MLLTLTGMAERCDSNDTIQAEQSVRSSSVQRQSGEIIHGLEEHDRNRQTEQVGVSRQEAEWSGGSRQGVEQGDNMRDKLEDVGAVVEEPGIEVQRDTNEEAVLTGLVSTRVELAQDVLMEEVPDQSDGDEPSADDSHYQATFPQEQREVSRKTAKGALQTFAWNTLHQLEYTVRHLTVQLHKMCRLCKGGLDLHQQSLENLHHEVDKCSKSFYSFLSKVNELEKQSSSLELLEGSIKSINLQLRELENLFDSQTVTNTNRTS